MPQIIVVTGAILASSIGVALAGLILRSTITSARRSRDGEENRMVEFTGNISRDSGPWDFAARGYDSPELAQEDALMRDRSPGHRHNLH